MNKTTLVIGVSLKTDRYSNKAVRLLQQNHHKTHAFGIKAGQVVDTHIETELIDHKDIHTVSIYLNPLRQSAYYQYVISLQPERVIFNPGTENPDFEVLLKENNISSQNACTLVLLNTGQY